MKRYYAKSHGGLAKVFDGAHNECVIWCVSMTLAKRVANALNIYKPKRRRRAEAKV